MGWWQGPCEEPLPQHHEAPKALNSICYLGNILTALVFFLKRTEIFFPELILA